MNSKLEPCPFCGSVPSIRKWHDEDMCFWAQVKCSCCGASSRGNWTSSLSEVCPIFYDEVRSEWNRRSAPQPAVPDGYVPVPRAAVTEVLRISDRQHPAWDAVKAALLSAAKGVGS